MISLSSVTIDAGVLAVPHPSCSIDDAYQYVDTLLDWKKILNVQWIAIYMSERASEALIEDDLFPLRDQLKELINTHGIIEYDVNTVARIVNQLLTITPSFETYYRMKDVLTDQFETKPDVIKLITHNGLQSDLIRCITLIAILRKNCSLPLGGHSLILREAPKQVIKVRAQIYDLEHERDDLSSLTYHPESFVGDVLVCDDFKGLIDCLDESAILVGTSDDIGIKLSVRIALFKYSLVQGEVPDWENITVPGIGTQFRDTCQNCCSDQGGSLQPKILRSIVETIRCQNLAAVHPLRTGKGGNNPQRLRGSDKAQRRDIDYEFHLHYWDCDNGTIEFASVVHHNDFSIPE